MEFLLHAFENGLGEVPEGQDPLAVPYKLDREWVIKAKKFALVPLTPMNYYIGLLSNIKSNNAKNTTLLLYFLYTSTH